MAGLFFCLASTKGARLLFLTCCNTPKHKLLQHVLCRPCNYTTNTAKQRAGLYRGVSCNCTHSTAHNARPTQADIIPPAPRWCVSQRRSTSSAYQILTATPGRCIAQHSPPIIIMYIRGQRRTPVIDPCQTVQHIADHASPAGWIAGKC